jgi:hypothetical protein
MCVVQITDLMEVTHLQSLHHLQILWLCDNPCVGNSATEYRKRTIAMLRKCVSCVSRVCVTTSMCVGVSSLYRLCVTRARAQCV